MDNYENVVIEYLRADRSVFVNTECCIQLNEGSNPDTSGPHWYCDAVAVDFRSSAVFLCEVSFATQLAGLTKRLQGWAENWSGVCDALARDSKLPADWPVRPWLFIPEDFVARLIAKLEKISPKSKMPSPRITTLEAVQPWKYQSWNRVGESEKIETIPKDMR